MKKAKDFEIEYTKVLFSSDIISDINQLKLDIIKL